MHIYDLQEKTFLTFPACSCLTASTRHCWPSSMPLLIHKSCYSTDRVIYREPPGSAVSRNKDDMVRWLSGLADKDEVSRLQCAWC